MINPTGISRRAFLQTGAASTAAVAGGILPVLSAPALENVRIGVIGIGGRGYSLTETMLSLPGVQIRAVCDILPQRTELIQRLIEKRTGTRPEAYAKDETHWQELVARQDLEAVIIATPWELHTPMAVAAMRAGKYAGVEVPAAITLEECWELIRVSEETGKSCMMLENVCYYQNVLSLLRMVREGCFGDLLHCEAGYQHDCRSIMFDSQGQLTWRGRHAARLNGNQYPTHPIGPIAHWMNINRGDRFAQLISLSTPAKGLRQYAAEKWGKDHERARQEYAQGDVNTTLLKTANGLTVTLYFDMMTYRPYDLIFRLQGVNGIYMGTHDQICLAGSPTAAEKWEAFGPYLKQYPHPLWQSLSEKALKQGGHGGADYITLHEFVRAIRHREPTPQDVYDAATWSAIFPLSIRSVAQNSQPEVFPDFTRGKWKTNRPIPIGEG